MLHHVVPPAFAVGVAGGFGQEADGVLPVWLVFGSWRRTWFCAFGVGRLNVRFNGRWRLGELKGLGQVHEAHGYVGSKAVADRLPFRGELGEGIVDGAAWGVGYEDEQRHGRGHFGFQGEGKDVVGVGRAFDQETVGSEFDQGSKEAAGRTGSVVAYSEDVDVV